MPRERLRGREGAQNGPYRSVPGAEHFILLDRKLSLSRSFRRRFDPSAESEEELESVPMLIFEKGEEIPEWAVTKPVWDGNRIAALDESAVRIDTPGPHEQNQKINAPQVLRDWRRKLGIREKKVFTCQDCGAEFDTQQALAGHTGACTDDDRDGAESGELEELEELEPESASEPPVRKTRETRDETDEGDGETDERDETEVFGDE